MCEEFSTVSDMHCKSTVSVNYFKICCFSERIVSASRELEGIDQSHSFLFSLNSVSCFGKSLTNLMNLLEVQRSKLVRGYGP